jgi:RNA polymerase sigma factor (sigma-70 family)
MEDLAIVPLDAAPAPSALADPPSGEGPQPAAISVQRSPEQAEQLVLDLIAAHADSLLRTARRYSLCADDAQDAYQRALEILMRHSARLDADRASGWLHTVVKHEALAINKARSRILGGEEVDLDAIETRTSPSPEDRVLAFEQVARSAEALQRLKPQEVRALWLKAMGNSYQEICEATGWSYTKVNRCLAEGRKSFLARYAGIEEGEECRRWAPVISAMVDGEASAEQLVALRPHLRNCAACRAAVRELRGSNAPLAALFPVGAVGALGDHDGGSLDAAGDLLSRLWHSLWGDLSDRAATAAFRAQSLAQAVLPGKSAAIFASVAALAGGGVAIDEAEKAEPPRAALHVTSVSTAADRITRAATVATTPAPPAAGRASTTSATSPDPAARGRARARRAPKRRVRTHRKHVVVHVSRPPATTVAAPRRSAPAATAADRGPATPAVTAATPTPPPATPPATPPARAPWHSAPAGGTGGAGSGEFGLESG